AELELHRYVGLSFQQPSLSNYVRNASEISAQERALGSITKTLAASLSLKAISSPPPLAFSPARARSAWHPSARRAPHARDPPAKSRLPGFAAPAGLVSTAESSAAMVLLHTPGRNPRAAATPLPPEQSRV